QGRRVGGRAADAAHLALGLHHQDVGVAHHDVVDGPVVAVGTFAGRAKVLFVERPHFRHTGIRVALLDVEGFAGIVGGVRRVYQVVGAGLDFDRARAIRQAIEGVEGVGNHNVGKRPAQHRVAAAVDNVVEQRQGQVVLVAGQAGAVDAVGWARAGEVGEGQ
nr:hypothetical protein [Tanacetum cinerariifolium]